MLQQEEDEETPQQHEEEEDMGGPMMVTKLEQVWILFILVRNQRSRLSKTTRIRYISMTYILGRVPHC